MSSINIFGDEFARMAKAAGIRARNAAWAPGHPVVLVDALGRYVQEMPDGTLFEIRLNPGMPRESHLEIPGILATPVG